MNITQEGFAGYECRRRAVTLARAGVNSDGCSTLPSGAAQVNLGCVMRMTDGARYALLALSNAVNAS